MHFFRYISNLFILEDKNIRQKLSNKQKTNLKSNKNKISNPYDADDSDPEDIPSSYTQVSIQVIYPLSIYYML